MPATLDGYRLLAASMDGAMSFPLMLSGSRAEQARKIKIEGRITAMFADHNYFLLEATRHAAGTQLVLVDSKTKVRWKGKLQPQGGSAWEALALRDEVLVEGVQNGHDRILAVRILRLRSFTVSEKTSP